MKKIFLSILCIVSSLAALAGQVSEQEAYDIAQQFMQGKLKSNTATTILRSARIGSTQKSFYVFNAENKGGFVIVSGDDRTPAILGYSNRGEIDEANMPCNLKWLLDSYDKAISNLSADYKPSTTRASETKTAIEPLIKTQWGQGSPYNDLCPQLADGGHCVTGCVATAMAQIINYNRWPQDATSTIAAYTSNTNNISMPALPAYTFDWNNMNDNAKARLMLYCGQSVNMDYGAGASGAYMADAASALQDVFGYSKSTSYKSRSSASSDEWNDLLYEEVSAGRAVLFGGQSSSGGHAFVVDGYSDGKYHINWGWDGYCDGYFTLDDLAPTGSDGFNSEQEIVYNITPPADASDVTRPKTIVTNMSASSSSLERTSATDDFASLTISSTLQSDMSETATIQVGLALYDDNGLVKLLSSDSHEFTTTDSYTYEAAVTIDSSIPQGEYRLVAVSRINDTDEWIADAGSSDVYISVTVSETELSLKVLPSGSDDEYYIDFGNHTIDGITYHLYSEYENNRATILPFNGTDKYSGELYIPDNVSYQNMTFDVFSYEASLSDSPELTSLSTSLNYLFIYACPKLTNLELREGVTSATIENCDALESITYPASCSYIGAPSGCDNLKEIVCKNKRKFEISYLNDLNYRFPALTDIYLSTDIPPTTEVVTYNVDRIRVHIPAGTLETYNHSDWKGWTLIEDQSSIPVYVAWDYCGNDEGDGGGLVIGNGDDDVEFAMRIPADCLEAYKGCQISAIEFSTPGRSINDWHYEDVEYVFLTTPGTDYLAKKSVNTIRGTWMNVELDEPYTITGEELFVGVGRHYALGMNVASRYVTPEDGFWCRVMGTDYGGYQPGVWNKGFLSRALPIRAIITGEKLPTDVVVVNSELIEYNNDSEESSYGKMVAASKLSPSKNGNRYFQYTTDGNGSYYLASQTQNAKNIARKVVADNEKQIKLRLRNRTPKLVKNVTLDIDINGKQQSQQTVETVMLINHDDIVYVDLPNEIKGRNQTVKIDVSLVDDVPDEIPANSSSEVSYSVPASTNYPRKVVMEEVTGTWCGYCPRGIVGIEKMNEQYPDNFIAIAVHDDSDMWPVAYDSLFAMVSSVPTAYINRLEWIDPSPFDLTDKKDGGVATIKATASFAQSEEKINVTTESIFGFSDNGSTEYRIAYVLLEDSVGPYYQRNYYSNPTAEHSDDIMDWWIHQDAYVETVYNDVARAIYDYNGIEGLLPMEITEGETYKSEYSLTIPDNVQNSKNLKVVVLLLDTTTGEILNADRTAISGEPYSGIAEVTADKSSLFDVYNMQGMRVRSHAKTLKGLPSGIYIINNKKVIVK